MDAVDHDRGQPSSVVATRFRAGLLAGSAAADVLMVSRDGDITVFYAGAVTGTLLGRRPEH
jgi:hypothetical protein